MEKIIVEICCGSADDVHIAAKAGAHRAELSSALFLGGLTASVGEVAVAKKAGIPIIAMVRPREGGFCYTDLEFETMLLDTEALLKAGADGIVFGILHPDGTVDEARCKTLLSVVGEKTSVFHRAIDVVPDWKAALDTLITLGVDRVLTSGQHPSVHYGAPVVRAMRDYAAGRIEILPGAGISLQNSKEVVEATGCGQIHVYLDKKCTDTSTARNPAIHFGGALYPPEELYSMADGGDIRRLMEGL